MTEQNAVTQAEFARMLDCSRSYVTALKKADRLVMNAIGNVLVEESRKRIAETADPNRDDVAQRWAAERGKAMEVQAVAAPDNEEAENEAPVGHDYQRSRAKKEHYLAEQARIDFEQQIGKLVEKSDVDAAVADVVTTFRQRMENLPHRIAPELVGKDLDAIRATLKQEVHGALDELQRELSQHIEQVGNQE